jgi:hypothetical protein
MPYIPYGQVFFLQSQSHSRQKLTKRQVLSLHGPNSSILSSFFHVIRQILPFSCYCKGGGIFHFVILQEIYLFNSLSKTVYIITMSAIYNIALYLDILVAQIQPIIFGRELLCFSITFCRIRENTIKKGTNKNLFTVFSY